MQIILLLNKILVTLIDELNDKENLSTFTRTLNNQKSSKKKRYSFFQFVDGVLDFKEKVYDLTKIKVENTFNKKNIFFFLTVFICNNDDKY